MICWFDETCHRFMIRTWRACGWGCRYRPLWRPPNGRSYNEVQQRDCEQNIEEMCGTWKSHASTWNPWPADDFITCFGKKITTQDFYGKMWCCFVWDLATCLAVFQFLGSRLKARNHFACKRRFKSYQHTERASADRRGYSHCVAPLQKYLNTSYTSHDINWYNLPTDAYVSQCFIVFLVVLNPNSTFILTPYFLKRLASAFMVPEVAELLQLREPTLDEEWS